MPVLTVWSSGSTARVHQLSDDPEDGTAQEQIAKLSELDAFAGYTCVSEDYSGPIPAGPVKWNGSGLVSAAAVPSHITPRQVRLFLLSQNLLDQVEAIIAAQDKATQIAWEFASEFRRDDPLLQALAANIPLTEEQLDAFFVSASNI